MGLGSTHCKYHMCARRIYFKDSMELDRVVVIIILVPGNCKDCMGAAPTYCRYCVPVGPAHCKYCMGAGTITKFV